QRCINRKTVADRARSGRKVSALTRSNLFKIKTAHKHKINPGQRKTATRLGISKSSVGRALKNLKLYPYHRVKASKITEDHVISRLKSAKKMLRFGIKNWLKTVNTDWSGHIGLLAGINSKNDVIYSEDSKQIPN